MTGLSLDRLWRQSRAEILALATDGDTFSPEKAVALAELLCEDDHHASGVRARWLYEAALAAGGPVPLDVHDRIAALPEDALDLT